MPGKQKIYTKTGDDGTTSLVGGSRVDKFDSRLEAYGTVDELNAAIGVIKSFKLNGELNEMLEEVQNKLFNIGSRLASDEKGDAFTLRLSVTPAHLEFLERSIDDMEKDLPELTQFILPGGTSAAAFCHIARTICRRAERRIVDFSRYQNVQPEIIKYINRLSDFLFVMARKINHLNGEEEKRWKQS